MALTISSRDRRDTTPRPESAVASFQQQGTVEWTNLAGYTLNSSLSVISRISTAGVDTYTIIASQILGGCWLWNDNGRKQFDLTFSQLCGVWGYRNILYFGIGVKHITDILAATEQGARFVAISACLSECYPIPFVSGVMLEMMSMLNLPMQTHPSLSQWRALVEGCAGIMAKSAFSTRAEHIMGLDGETRVANTQIKLDRYRAFRSGYSNPFKGRGVTSKEAFAEALLGLARLSQRELRQITLVGRADAGFIAAIADWLLGLYVVVRSEATGEVLFTNCDKGEPQLVVIYEKPKRREPTGTETETTLQCVGKVFYLPDATTLIRREKWAPESTVFLSGRVAWEKALSATFGQDFANLMAMNTSFSTILGSAARVFHSVAEAEPEAPGDWLKTCRTYFPDSHGVSFVHLARKVFPELEVASHEMDSAARLSSFHDAKAKLEAAFVQLAISCGCWLCSPLPRPPGTDLPMRYCLGFLAETIIRVVRLMSGIESEVRPMRAGLEMMYDQQVSRALDEDGNKLESNTLRRLLESDGQSEPLLISLAEVIFGGGRSGVIYPEGQYVSALSESGLCYYLDVLREPTQATEQLALVKVTPGRIEHLGRAFDIIADGGGDLSPYAGGPLTTTPRPEMCISARVKADLKHCFHNPTHLEALVRQHMSPRSSSGLRMEYGIAIKGEIACAVGPAKAVQQLCRSRGLVNCPRKRCEPYPDLERAILASQQESPCRKLDVAGAEVWLIQGDLVSVLLAAAGVYDPIMQTNECVACCVRAGIRKGWQRFVVVSTSVSSAPAAITV